MNNSFLYKIWIFNIDFSTVFSFLIGLLMGMILLLLIYALVVVCSLKTKDFWVKTQADDLTTEEVKQMVLDTQKSFKDKTLRADLGRVAHCLQLCKDLAYAIAVRYYPASKHPLLELSVNEITQLTQYVSQRVNELLDHRGIRILRKMKISTMVDLSNKKKQVENSKAFQATVAVGSKISKVKYVLNFINPLNWGRKLIVDRVMNLVINQICLVVISIVGEETYKIYSKKVFHKEVEIDTGSEEFIEEMAEGIKTAAQEMETSEEVAPKEVSVRLKGKMIQPSDLKESSLNSVSEKISLKKKQEEIYEKA